MMVIGLNCSGSLKGGLAWKKKVKEFWKQKQVAFYHIFLDVMLLIYCISFYFAGNQVVTIRYVILFVYALLCIVTELVHNRHMQKKYVHSKRIIQVEKVYCFLRPALGLAYYYMAETKLEGIIFLILFLIYFFELFYSVALGKKAHRVIIYVTYICLYGMISFVMLVVLAQDNLSRVTVGIAIRELVTVSVVLVLIVVVSEMMSHMWDFFEKDIFRQNRALEDLNKVNDKMKEQQEKINRVNEKLGVQKIELQLANKKINRSHDEMSVQNELSSIIISSIEIKDMLDKIVDMSKVDIGGNEIEGAKMQVLDLEGNIIDEWISGKEAHKIKNLEEGKTYILHEDVCVDGFVKATDIEFVVTVDKETQHLKMIDKIVNVIKTDMLNGDLIDGAELIVTDEEGNEIDRWISSSKEPHHVSGLEEGKKYFLEEKSSPYGYEIASKQEFIVELNKETQIIEMKDMPSFN